LRNLYHHLKPRILQAFLLKVSALYLITPNRRPGRRIFPPPVLSVAEGLGGGRGGFPLQQRVSLTAKTDALPLLQERVGVRLKLLISLLTFISFAINDTIAQYPYVNGFESGDPAVTFDLTTGTSLGIISSNPNNGTDHVRLVSTDCGGSDNGCYDGSVITELLTFTAGKFYKVEVYV